MYIYMYVLYMYTFVYIFVYILCFRLFFCFWDSRHQRPPAQLGALRGLRRNQARRRRLGDEFAPGGENLHNALGT